MNLTNDQQVKLSSKRVTRDLSSLIGDKDPSVERNSFLAM